MFLDDTSIGEKDSLSKEYSNDTNLFIQNNTSELEISNKNVSFNPKKFI